MNLIIFSGPPSSGKTSVILIQNMRTRLRAAAAAAEEEEEEEELGLTS